MLANRLALKLYLDEHRDLRGWRGHALYRLYVVLAFVEDLFGLPVNRRRP